VRTPGRIARSSTQWATEQHSPGVKNVRPKYALWLVAAVVSSAWYLADPQARDSHTAIRGAGVNHEEQLAVAHRVQRSPPSIAERSPL